MVEKPKRMGRPPLDPDKPLDARYELRLARSEIEELRDAAARLDLPLAEWARGVLLRHARRVLRRKA